jgi:flagellar basal-body rod protein FlgB
MISSLFKKTNLPSLVRHLDLSSLNRKVLHHNIANVNTPGYLRREMVFSDTLSDSMKRLRVENTQRGHIRPSGTDSVQIVESQDKTIKNGINNVDVDQEMVEIAKNQMESMFSITMLIRLFKSLKTVAKDSQG